MKWMLIVLTVVTASVAACSSGELPLSDAQASEIELSKAILSGKTDQVAAMLDANPALAYSPNSVGETPLHYAARADDAAMVRLLLERGAQVWARNDSEELPVQVAAEAGASEEVLALLRGEAAAGR